MKIATYESHGSQSFGACIDDYLIDIPRAVREFSGRSNGKYSTLAEPQVATDLFQDEGTQLLRAREAVEEFVAANGADAGLKFDSVTILPAVPRPPKFLCVARNYAAHAKEAGRELSEIPILFARLSASLVGHRQPIIRPVVSSELDWEGELAVVIGKGGRHVSRDKAMSHVGAYTIFNDATIRDYQFRVAQYTEGKNFASTGPLGPYLVTADEIDDPNVLDIETFVNGVQKQNGNTRDMVFDIPTLIEQISTFLPLEVGDVIAMGTPEGVGFKRQPPEFLTPGDTVEIKITGLGSLINPVAMEEV